MPKQKELPIYIATLPEFLEWIDLCHSILKDKDGMLFFRGHSDEKWSLKPSAFRRKHFSERKALADYIRKHYPSTNYLANMERILLEMQQHGLATRLQQWSASPLDALYYACVADEESDGVVYCLDPWVDVESAGFAGSESAGGDEAMQHARMCLALGWSVSETIEYAAGRFGYVINKEQLEQPIPLQAGSGDGKYSFFMLWGSKKSDIKGFKGLGDNLLEVRIRKEDKKELVLGLKRLGVNM